MPTSPAAQPLGKLRIPVPRQFRDHLIASQNRRYTFTLIIYAAVILFFGLVMHWGWHVDFVQIFFLLGSLFVWKLSLKSTWYYEIDQSQMTLIWFEVGGRFWRWLPVQWQRIEIIGIEEAEWRGLPALRIIRQVKNPKWRPDWIIVYAHEDVDMVRTQILPLLEQYRRLYRTPILADKLREG